MKWWLCSITASMILIQKHLPSIHHCTDFFPSNISITCIRMQPLPLQRPKMEKKITQELFKGTIGWVDWQRPGFDLGLQLKACLAENPGIRGIMLGSHGLFTWGDTAYESYVNTLEVIEQCAAFIETAVASKKLFEGEKIAALPKRKADGTSSSIGAGFTGFLFYPYQHGWPFYG
eukprot:Opistho-1_new@36275